MKLWLNKSAFWITNILCFLLLLFFQNCGKVNFNRDQDNQEGVSNLCDLSSFTGNLIINDTTFEASPSNLQIEIPSSIDLSKYTIEMNYGDGSAVVGPVAATNYRNIQHTYTAAPNVLTTYSAVITLRSTQPNQADCEKIFNITVVFDLRVNPACIAALSGPGTGTVGVLTNEFSVDMSDLCPTTTTTTAWDQNYNGTTPGATGWEGNTVIDPTINYPKMQFTYDRVGQYQVITSSTFAGNPTTLISNAVTIDITCPSPASLPNSQGQCVCHSSGQITTNGQCPSCGAGSTGLDPNLGCLCPAVSGVQLVYSQTRQRCECPSTNEPPNIGSPARCPVNCGTINLANNRTLQLNDGATANIARVTPASACGTACEQRQIRCEAGTYKLNDASNTVVNSTNSSQIYLATDITACTNSNVCSPSLCGTLHGKATRVIPRVAIPELCAANNTLSTAVSPTNPAADTAITWGCQRSPSVAVTCNGRFCGDNQIIINNGTACQTCPVGTQRGTGDQENQCVPIQCPSLTIADGTVQLNYNQQINVTHDVPNSESCLQGTLTCEVNGSTRQYVLASNNESIVVNNSTLAMQIYRNTPPISVCPTPVAGCFRTSPTQDGSSSKPWIINSCSCLQAMSTNPGDSRPNHHFRLGQDIDCTTSANYNGGSGFYLIYDFSGLLEGNNFTVSNLTSRQTYGNFMWLSGGTVQNIIFSNINLEDTSSNGFVAGLFNGNEMNHTLRNIRITGGSVRGISTSTLYASRNFRGLAENINIQNVNLQSKIPANTRNDDSLPDNSMMAGMILGLDEGPTHKGRILNSSFQGTISGGDFVGGLVDTNIGGEIRNSTVNLTYNGTATRLFSVQENKYKSFSFIGGVSRLTLGGSISNVTTAGTVTLNLPSSTEISATYVGGLTQQVDSTLYNGQLRTGLIENSTSNLNFILRNPNPLSSDFSTSGGGLAGNCYISYADLQNLPQYYPASRPRIVNSRATGSISYRGFKNDGLNSSFGNFIPWRTGATRPLSDFCNVDSVSSGSGQVILLPN